MTKEEACRKLKVFGQEHLLRYYDELAENEKTALLAQIDELDFSVLATFSAHTAPKKRGRITPIRAMQIPEIKAREAEYDAEGLRLIREGKLAAVLLAGGMGTRLGYDGPKGTLDIGRTHPVFIFQRLIENLTAVTDRAGCVIPLFIMTSEKNDAATRSFFAEHHAFGYPEDQIHFFRQDTAPAVNDDGKILLESKSVIAASPNGNGGWFRSLKKAGYLDLLHNLGVAYLNVFAVDNVLQRIADPVFLGAVAKSGCASGSKVIRKANRDEKVGVMCLEDGRPSVIEYYEMTDALLDARDREGDRAYQFGVILNYLFRLPDLEKAADTRMPVHFAHKAVPYLGPDGTTVKPEVPNAWKFEYFILDMIRELPGCLPFEVVREKEFAPIKNRTGADSIETAQALLAADGYRL